MKYQCKSNVKTQNNLCKKDADKLSQVSILTSQQGFILQYGKIWGFFSGLFWCGFSSERAVL